MNTSELKDFDAATDWYPIAPSHEIQPGLVTLTLLGGQEIALWRSSDGELHAWENRCPHRGTRFTLGRIVNDTLVCAYHGWRFEKEGGCSFIPANPTLTPPRSACAKTYSTREEGGMVWATLGDSPWRSQGDDHKAYAFSRSFVIFLSPVQTRTALLDIEDPAYEPRSDVVLASRSAPTDAALLYLQPMAPNRTTVHLWVDVGSEGAQQTPALKRAAVVFRALRDRIESLVA